MIVTSQYGVPRPLSPEPSPQQPSSTMIPGATVTLEPEEDDRSDAMSDAPTASFISANTSLGVRVGHGSIVGFPQAQEGQGAAQYAQEYRAQNQLLSTPTKFNSGMVLPLFATQNAPAPSSPPSLPVVVPSTPIRRKLSKKKGRSPSLSRSSSNPSNPSSPPLPPKDHYPTSSHAPSKSGSKELPEALPEPEREPFQEQRWMPRDPDAWTRKLSDFPIPPISPSSPSSSSTMSPQPQQPSSPASPVAVAFTAIPVSSPTVMSYQPMSGHEKMELL